MLGLWLDNRRLRLRDDLPRPVPAAGEARIEMLCAGICGTDLEMTRGYFDFTGIPGHEFVGRVSEGGGDLDGRRVVGEINAACGACPSCLAGGRNHCPARTVLGIAGRHGAFAEELCLPVANLHPVPDDLPNAEAVFTEPLAAALRIAEQVPVAGSRVLVVGDGRLAQLTAQALALEGAGVESTGRHERKLALLRARGIRTHPPGAVRAAAYDVAVECTGRPEGFETARLALRPGGTLVLKSTYAGALTFRASSLVVDEITVVGSRCGPFAPALRLLAGRRVEVAPLIDARYPLAQAERAFEHAARRGTLKILLEGSS